MAEEEKNQNTSNPENPQTTLETGTIRDNNTLSRE